MEQELEKIKIENPNCECPYNCPRHGKCSECQAYHKSCGDKTYCGK